MFRFISTLLTVLVVLPFTVHAKNLMVKGQMGSTIRFGYEQRIVFSQRASKLTASFVVPQSYTSPTYNQSVSDFSLRFSPRPTDRKESRDQRGNRIITATWSSPPAAVDVDLSFNAQTETRLQLVRTTAPFPLRSVPPDAGVYLQPTEQVQSGHPKIKQLAKSLTNESTTQFEAVQQVIAYVVDALRYKNPPPQYDALFALETGTGNCQNYSHLAAALLRAAGVPVRIVNGFTLDKPYNVAVQGDSYTFKAANGRHSWIEIWFPDLGWVPFDPQKTSLFVSNRFIRVELGVDNNEAINDGRVLWTRPRGSKAKPRVQSGAAGNFSKDVVQVEGTPQKFGPRNTLLFPNVSVDYTTIATKPPMDKPKAEPSPRDIGAGLVVFGNLDYPENVDFTDYGTTSRINEDTYEIRRNFLVESAEYVTTKMIQYAQVFEVKEPVKLHRIGLALHKYGGQGSLWLDLFEDDKGSPGELAGTSSIRQLREFSLRPGYRWEDFNFAGEDIVLKPGFYWIGLGFTGEPIVNWFYTYGKPVGPPEGTRSKGVFDQNWSNALAYEFNYRVIGKPQ